MKNIKEVKTVLGEYSESFDKKVNKLLLEGWVILSINTVKKGMSNYENFFCVLGRENKTKEVI